MSKIIGKPSRLFGLLLVILVFSVSLWIACGEQFQAPSGPQEAQEEIVLSPEHPKVRAVMAVQERHVKSLIDRPDVSGVGTGMTEDGQPAIVVFVKDNVLTKPVPARLEEVPVLVRVTGEFKALKGPPGGGGGFDPTARHRPAPNGVSIGHPDITAGTLGCLVEKGGNTYILSNNHVMADENRANINDPIYQPGPFDGGGPGDEIASLSEYEAINFSGADNTIDAAIALVDGNDVTGETVSYGAPSPTTIAAAVNMKVKKYGRTTEDTKGTISAINATVNVGYDSGVARFVGQIIITPGSFSAGGDSGSLIVVDGKGQNKQDDRKPVGLLFAGSSFDTIANPIDAVLGAFNVTVVGN